MTVLENLRKEYPYLYETHLHTSEASACVGSTGKDMAQACKDAGDTGIIVTNHNWHGNHCIDPSLPWEKWIRGREDYILTNGENWYTKEGRPLY